MLQSLKTQKILLFFTIFINCKDTGSLCEQLLHHHNQAISCGHMQRPEKKQGSGNLSAAFDFINKISTKEKHLNHPWNKAENVRL